LGELIKICKILKNDSSLNPDGFKSTRWHPYINDFRNLIRRVSESNTLHMLEDFLGNVDYTAG